LIFFAIGYFVFFTSSVISISLYLSYFIIYDKTLAHPKDAVKRSRGLILPTFRNCVFLVVLAAI